MPLPVVAATLVSGNAPMSNIIVPGQRPRSTRKANDLATLHEVATMIYHETAPLGMLMREFMEKLARCEDQLGITDESAASMPVPRGTPLSPHAQLAAVELGLKEIPPEIAQEIVHETVNPGGDVE